MTSQRSSYIPRPSIESSTALDRSSINDIHQFQLILLGDIAVGKSSLLRRYIDDSFTSEYFCTVGVEYNVKTQSVDNSIPVVVPVTIEPSTNNGMNVYGNVYY